MPVHLTAPTLAWLIIIRWRLASSAVWSAQKWLQGSFGIQTLASSFAAGAVFTIAQRMRRVGGLLAVPARLGAKVGHVALLLGFL
jgi:hypothetical protein